MIHRMVVPGWMCPLGWCKGFNVYHREDATLKDGTVFAWTMVEIDELRLSHASHLMLIEGVVPAWLFMGARLETVQNPGPQLAGPFMPLRLDGGHLSRVPYTFTNIVFGIPTIPAGAKLGDVVPAMFFALCTNPLT